MTTALIPLWVEGDRVVPSWALRGVDYELHSDRQGIYATLVESVDACNALVKAGFRPVASLHGIRLWQPFVSFPSAPLTVWTPRDERGDRTRPGGHGRGASGFSHHVGSAMKCPAVYRKPRVEHP